MRSEPLFSASNQGPFQTASVHFHVKLVIDLLYDFCKMHIRILAPQLVDEVHHRVCELASTMWPSLLGDQP